MTKEEQLAHLISEISRVESMIADTRYYIETALCLETKTIYENNLVILSAALSNLYRQREQLIE